MSLVIFMLPLGFFQQTRGFLVSYVKKIISLTFYMPLLLLLVLFNSFALQYAIKVGGSNEIVAKFGIIVVIGISLTLIQKVPEMINAIFGTQGGLTDAKSFVYQGVQIASAGAGAIAGSLKSVGRSAFGRTLEAYKGASVGTGNFLVKTEGAIGNAVNNIKNRASQPENIRTSVGFVNVGSKATR